MIETKTGAHVTTITLNRPEKLNAFAGTMREELRDAILAADADGECRVVVITGAGRAFCAGGDVEYMAALQRERDFASFRRLLDAGRDVVLAIATSRKPIVAAVNGVAAGAGCNLALACDYRIASDRATLGETFVRIGLHPDWGGTWLLPRLVGPGLALELLVTGRMVDAPEALAIGMVDRVVPAAELAGATEALARSFAAAPPIAVRGIKRALGHADHEALRAQLELEAEHQLAAFGSRDGAEGLRAFFEKRTPAFEGE